MSGILWLFFFFFLFRLCARGCGWRVRTWGWSGRSLYGWRWAPPDPRMLAWPPPGRVGARPVPPVRARAAPVAPPKETPLEALQRRYVADEITVEEYERELDRLFQRRG
ncbi:MAG: SHOCT domain-containing protein [Gemmatimonadetes bacterium]|nr:SHOCT domain-containing protein [Gemmatimonadota bacterium]